MKHLEELQAKLKAEETTTHDMFEELPTDVVGQEEPAPKLAKGSGGREVEVGAQELLHTSLEAAPPHGMRRSTPDLATTGKRKVPAKRRSKFIKLWQWCCPCRHWKLISSDG
jgi:hypothetical protein